MEFTEPEKKFLSQLGRNENGQQLIALMKRMKAHFSSIDSIDPKYEATAQVEGRKIFIAFANKLIEQINTQSRPIRELDVEDYE